MRTLIFAAVLLSVTPIAHAADFTAEDQAATEKVLNSQDAEDFAVNFKQAPENVQKLFRDPRVRAAMLVKAAREDDGWRLRSLNAIAPITETDALMAMEEFSKSNPYDINRCSLVAPFDIMFKDFHSDVLTWAKNNKDVSRLTYKALKTSLNECRNHALYNSDLRLSAEKIALDNPNPVPASGEACTFIQR